MVGKKIHTIFPIPTTSEYPVAVNYQVTKSYPIPHVVAMGTDTTKIRAKFNPGGSSRREGYNEIKSRGFNYSFCCNNTLKKIINGKSNYSFKDFVVFSDPFIYFRYEDIEKELSGIGEDSFLTLNVLLDSLNEPLDLKSHFIVAQINRKMDEIFYASENESNGRKKIPLKYHIPLIFTTLDIILNIDNGLDEFIFTDIAREHLRYQLLKMGLKEKISSNYAYHLIKTPIFNIRSKSDESILEDRIKRTKHTVFIPSNFGRKIGDESIANHITTKGRDFVWDKKIVQNFSSSCRIIPEVTSEMLKNMRIGNVETVTENTLSDYKYEMSIIENMEEEKLRLSSSQISRCVLIINNSLKSIIKNMPLVNELFNKYGKIDILTNSKLDESVRLLNSEFIEKIFDLDDLDNGFMDLIRYKDIVLTDDFMGKLPSALSRKLDIIKKNHDPILSSTIKYDTSILPSCSYIPHTGIKEGSVAICSSIRKNLYNAKSAVRWEHYDLLISRFLNNDIPIVLVSHANEKNIIRDIDLFRRKRSVTIITNSSYKYLSGVLRETKLLITHPYSDIFWLSYASNQNTMLIVGPSKENYPNSPYVTKIGNECKCKTGPERCLGTPCLSNLNFEEVYESICKKL